MLLDKLIEKPKISLEEIFQKEVVFYSKTIDCSILETPNYKLKFGEYEKQLTTLKDDLKDFNAPCLYWFSVENEEIASQLIGKLNQYREIEPPTKRKIPVKNNNKNSTTIYVGKREAGFRKNDSLTNIAGRIAIHFGYNKAASAQGLQLFYWTKEKITVNVIKLPSESAEYLILLEKLLAKKLLPLCGRH